MTAVQESTAAPAAPAATGDGEPPPAAQVALRRWRAVRVILILFVVLIAVSLTAALLKPRTESGYLDPASADRDGSRALAQIIAQRGTPVRIARDSGTALSDVGAAPRTLLVIVRSERLTTADLARLRGVAADVLLVEPESATLATFASAVKPATRAIDDVASPGCSLPAATAAGPVGFGGYAVSYVYPGGSAATSCYRSGDDTAGTSRLVQSLSGTRLITVIGSGTPFTNGHLDQHGNAALGLNLAAGHGQVVWLMPDLPKPGSGATDKSFDEMIPTGVKLAALQLFLAVVVTAVWRTRRFGPIVAEALPVAVRSAETVEGRARLYRGRRARDRAALALRSALRERLVPRLGLPRSTAADPAYAREIVTAVAARAGGAPWDERAVGWALYGPEPADDAELLRLSDSLDDLEKRVLGS